MKNLRIGGLAVMLAAFLCGGTVFAHSGGTDKYGCHTDHSTGAYHCHNGSGSSGGGSYNYTPAPKPTCGYDSYKDAYGSCVRYSDISQGATSAALQRGQCVLSQYSVGEECLNPIEACIKRHGPDTDSTNSGTCSCKQGYQFQGNNCKYIKQSTNKHAEDVSRIDRKIQRSATERSSSSASSVSSAASVSCTIKGNISTAHEKIYHMLGCPNYKQTKIDAWEGERMFCSEKDAKAAGWRKALNCPK